MKPSSMLLSKRTEIYLLFQSLIVITLYVIYMVGGYKSFNVWNQMNALAGLNPLENLNHPHGLRYLVIWPALWIADYFEVARNSIFGLFVIANLTLCAVLTARIQAVLSHAIESRWTAWLYLFTPIFITLSFPMNGRLSYMLLGSAIMAYSYMHWLLAIARHAPLLQILPYFFLNILALALLSVSSGCFTVGMITAILHCLIFAAIQTNRRRAISHILMNLVSLIFFFFIQYRFIQMNLDYYGGSVFAMLTHGPGEILSQLNPSPFVLGPLLGFIAFPIVLTSPYWIFFIRQNLLIITPLCMVILSLAFGIFGYSTLLTGAIALMVLSIHTGGYLLQTSHWNAAIRAYLKASFPRQIIPPRLWLVSLLMATILSLAFILILPNNWKQFNKHALESDMKSSMTYITKEMEYTSFVKGQLSPGKIITHPDGMVYMLDSNVRILRLRSDHAVEVYAGDTEPGDQDGPRLDARFNQIRDITFDREGNLYIADSGNHKVKKIDPQGNVTTIAGSGKIGLLQYVCPALKCRLDTPYSLQVLPNNDLLILQSTQILRLTHQHKVFPYLNVANTSGVASDPNKEIIGRVYTRTRDLPLERGEPKEP